MLRAAPSYPFHDLPDDLDPIERLMRLMPISDTRRDLEWQRANAATVERIKAYTRDNLIPDHATWHDPESGCHACRL